MTTSLETTLKAFVADATQDCSMIDPVKPKKKPALGIKTEGVWVSSNSGPSRRLETSDGLKEEDEMIWWQWDRKIVGFSEW